MSASIQGFASWLRNKLANLLRRQRRQFVFLSIVMVCGFMGWLLSVGLMDVPIVRASSSLLATPPKQPLGSYDYFGKVLSPTEAAALVKSKGLNPHDPKSYLKIGAVHITQKLLDVGEKIFFERKIGDRFGLQRVFGFQVGLATILPDVQTAIGAQQGKPTSNLPIVLSREIRIGSQVFPQGTRFPTGFDIPKRSALPIGLKSTGEITCALCHVALSPKGEQLKGLPNGDLAIPFLIALAPNSAAGFARVSLNPLDPRFQGNGSGKTILDSNGRSVKLPDPTVFEQVFDDLVLAVPFGHFESSPDGIFNTTQIPPLFTFKAGPYTAGGEFAVGPFGGLSALNNGVHSSEINLLAAAQRSAETTGIDREVYLGTVLQNAADPTLRIPNGVKPSEWLRRVAPDLAQAELEDQVPAPGLGRYPNLNISLLTYNGLVFSPETRDRGDIASGKFFFANNAMSAWQNSLVPPPNRSRANYNALNNGSVDRGAEVFQASCLACHRSPFFTDNKIHPIAEINTQPARAKSRLRQNALLVAPKMYSLDTPVPIPANATVLDVPTAGISPQPNQLPNGLLPNGGYKTPSLLGLYLTAPYLHDGGVAVRKNTLAVADNGSYQIIDASGLGLSGTLSRGVLPDASASLRALIDRNLRAKVVTANRSNPALQVSNLDGSGHEFYVEGAQRQQDLINFLLALDDKPSEY